MWMCRTRLEEESRIDGRADSGTCHATIMACLSHAGRASRVWRPCSAIRGVRDSNSRHSDTVPVMVDNPNHEQFSWSLQPKERS